MCLNLLSNIGSLPDTVFSQNMISNIEESRIDRTFSDSTCLLAFVGSQPIPSKKLYQDDIEWSDEEAILNSSYFVPGFFSESEF